jgi:EAL domain-containing protein (putative c-di-GMP-specific phosphodiesterase class I)
MLHAARALGVGIVAEGVEEEAQAIFLRTAGCDHMQGYLFARPMPAHEIEAHIRERRPLAVQPAPPERKRA